MAALYVKVPRDLSLVKTKVLPVDKQKIIKVEDKEQIAFGDTILEVIHTPGHTSGSISLLDKTNNILYSGDTIFEKTYGRTDLVNGSHDSMKETLNNLFNRFEDIQVFPGHGNIFNLKDAKRRIRLLFAYKG